MVVKVKKEYFSNSIGNGPVNALDNALRGVLIKSYPILKKMNLVDYKVRILTPDEGTKAITRVVIESSDENKKNWSTVGVSSNVINASYIALKESITKADSILKKAKVFDNLEDAIKDLNIVYATSNRKRELNTEVVSLKKGIKIIYKSKNNNVGILFGPERSGLSNQQISLCDKIIEIPLNKNFKSLNLAQSVLLVAYEIFNLSINKKILQKKQIAKKKELLIFFRVLIDFLENKNFFKVKEKKKIMVQNIKTIFNKAELSEKELKILLGIIKNLVNKKYVN